MLLKSGWKPGCGIEVEIVPGSTALSACASLVGAPLTHDFCSISLSDLLTPWPTIAKRIDAAGRSDFVVALYNPKSGRRTQQIVEAQRILLQYRKPDTPVAIVKSAYREAQNIQMVRLDEMKDCKIGMLTTVLVGNSSTYLEHGLMITPRGYANKYENITGDAIEGEKRGRSLSMGLSGWKHCVREYLRTGNEHSLRDVARHFDSPTGEIITAISEANPNSGEDDNAGEYTAAPVLHDITSVIEAAKRWGLLRAVIRNDAGAVSELMIHASNFSIRRDWLNIENEHFHLHINWSSIQQAWFIRRGDKLCGVHFTDEQNETVFNLSLLREDGVFNTDALKAFEQDWASLTEISELEKASNE